MALNEELLYMLDEKKRLSKKMYADVKKEGVLTGSFVFGGRTEDSDIDVFFPPLYVDKYKRLIDMGYAVYNSYDEEKKLFFSLYVRDPRGRLLNLLLFYTQHEYDKHLYATKAMKSLKGNKYFDNLVLQNKEHRVELFRLFKKTSPQGVGERVGKLGKDYKGTGEDFPLTW